MLTSARIVKKEAGIRLTPILKHTEKGPAGKVFGDICFSHESEPDPIESCFHHQSKVVND